MSTVVAAMDIGLVCGRLSYRNLLIKKKFVSAFVILRQEPASGTRLRTFACFVICQKDDQTMTLLSAPPDFLNPR